MIRLRGCPDVTKIRLATLLALGSYMNSDGSNGHVSEETLAGDVGVSDRAVREHLGWARDAGYLERTARGHRRGDGSTSASTYAATVPTASTGTGPPVERAAQPEDRKPSTGRSQRLNRKITTPQPEDSDTPYKEDQVLDQELTNHHHPREPAPAAVAEHPDGGGGEDPFDEQAPGTDEDVDAVIEPVAEALGLPPSTLHAVRPAVAAALAHGWPAPALAEHLVADFPREGERRRPAAILLGWRLGPKALPPGPARCSCQGCNRWRRAADALARTAPTPATCITHKVQIEPGGRCAGCEAEAAVRLERDRQDRQAQTARQTDRRQRIEGAREALGLPVVAALTGQQNPRNRFAAALLGDWLDDHGWDLDAAREHAAARSAS